MKRRVLSLTMAFLLAFAMLPTQAVAEELPEHEEVVEENLPAEEVLTEESEEKVTEEVTEAPTGEETEDAEVKEEVPAEQEEVSEVPAQEETKSAEAEKTTEAAAAQEIASPAEEIRPAEQQVSVQAMEANGIAVQAEDGETEEPVTPCVTHTFENGICTVCKYKCIHEKATDTECLDCKMTMIIKGEKDGAVTRYASLGDAFDNAPDDSMLTLLTDTYDRNDYKIIDKKYTIDPAGHTLDSWNIYIYREKNPASLTLTGSGKVKVSINLGSNADLNLPKTWNGSIKTVNILSGSHNSTKIAGGTIDSLVLYVNKLSISGGTFGKIRNNLDSKIWAPALLESGYVFKQGNQAIEFSRDLSANELLWNVTVEKCEEHRDKNNDGRCDYCDLEATFNAEVTAVDSTTARYSGLQGAFNEAQDDATVKLLADISAGAQGSAYTVDNKRITLDLGDKTISGSGISATNGAGLTITGNGTVDGEVTFASNSTGQLQGGTFGKITSVTKTLQELLPEGYAYRDRNGDTWRSDITGSSIENVVVLKAPIQQLDITNSIGKLTYGYSEDKGQHLLVNPVLVEGYNENEVGYEWHKVDKNGA